MAKARPANHRSPRPKLESRLRAFYSLGLKVQREVSKHGEHVPGLVVEQAKQLKVSLPVLYKASQFAKRYSPGEMHELCSLRTPSGQPLGMGHLCELILVPNKAQRKRLQNQTAQQGWSTVTLRANRRQLMGVDAKARKAGRKPKLARDLDGLLEQLAAKSTQWLRLANVIAPDDANAIDALQKLPKLILAQLLPLKGKMKTLIESARNPPANRKTRSETANARKRRAG